MVRVLNSRQSGPQVTAAAQEQVLSALGKPETCTATVVDKLKHLLELPSKATAVQAEKSNPTRIASKNKENECVRPGARIKRTNTQSPPCPGLEDQPVPALVPFASKVLNQCVGTLSVLLSVARKSSGCPLSTEGPPAGSSRKESAKTLGKVTTSTTSRPASSRPLSKLLEGRAGKLSETDPIDVLASCVECVMMAVSAMQDPDDNQTFELERIACRFVVGLLELTKSSKATSLLSKVHARLWPNNLPSQSAGRVAKTSVRDTRPRVLQARLAESGILLKAPASAADAAVSRIHIEVVCLVTALRCWLSENGLGASGVLQQLIMQKTGLYDRCKQLKGADVAAGSQSFDTVFRLLYRTSLENRENPYQVLELRLIAMRFFVESPTFTNALFAEQAFKFGLVFDQAVTANSARKYEALMSFYATVLDLALELLERGRKPELAACKWCDHYISVARKCNKSDVEARVANYRNKVFEGFAQPAAAGVDVAATVSTACSKLDFAATAIRAQDPRCELDEVVISNLDSARSGLESLNSLLSQMSQETFHSICATLARTCGLLWKLTERLALNETSDALPSYHEAWRHLLICVIRFFHTLVGCQKSEPESVLVRSSFDKILPAIIALTNTLGRLESTMYPDDDSTYLQSLQEIEPLCTRFGLTEPFKITSNTLFALGGSHYTKKEWSCARQDFAVACDYLARSVTGGQDDKRTDVTLLCKRYEYLAVTHTMCGDAKSATNAIDSALKMLGSFPDLMLDTGGTSLSATAINLINKHVKYQLSDSVTEYVVVASALGWAGDNAPRLADFLVSECELQLLLAAPPTKNSERGSMSVARWLLGLYDESLYPVRRARILMEQARLLRFFPTSTTTSDTDEQSAVLKHCQEAVELLKKATIESSYKEDEQFANQSENDLATAYSMLGIAFSEAEHFEMKPFTIALKVWKKLLNKVPLYTSTIKITIEDPKAKTLFFDMNATYRCIKSLANYFGMLRQSLNQIICLRLLLRLTTLLAADKSITRMSASLYAEIGIAYVALGYTGQAGVAFAQSRALVQVAPCSPQISAYCELSYAYYLSHIGNNSKSDGIFKSVEPVVSKSTTALAHEQLAPYHHRGLPAYAFHVHSHLAYAKADLALAIVESEQCLKLLKRICKKLKNPKDEVANLTAALQQTTLGSADVAKPASKPAHDLALSVSEWQLLKFLLDVYMWLGKLYVARGSVIEAEHFLGEGLGLASAVHAEIYRADFLLLLSEIAYRQDRVEDGNDASHQASDCQAKVTPDFSARDAVLAKMTHGNQQLREKDFEGAVKSLEECEGLLDSAMSQAVIAHLEDNPLRGSETPREKRIAQSPAVVAPAKPVKRIVRRPATTKSVKVVKPPPLADEFECFILGDIKVDVSASMAWGMCQLGDLEKAEKKLLNSDDTDQTGLLQMNFAVTAARLKLHKLLMLLRGNTLFQFFSESAFSLPWNVPCYPDRGINNKLTRAQKAAAELAKTIGNVTQRFEEAFRLVLPSGPSHVLLELCNGITFLNFTKAYLTDGATAKDSQLLALNSLYFLEAAKGLTYRREMVASLYERVLAGASRPAWPPVVIADTPPTNAPQCLNRILAAAHARDQASAPSEFFTELASLMPINWIVCTISIDLHRDDMLLTRFEHDHEPIVVRLPLQRQALRNADDSGVSCSDVLGELQEILDASNATTKDTAAYQTKAEKKEWWRARQELDDRLSALLGQVEGSWLGAFKGLLSADKVDFTACDDAFHVFRATMKKIVYGAVAQKSKRARRPAALDLDPGLCKMLLRLGPEPGYDDVEDALFYLMDAYQFSGVGINYDEIDLDGLVDEIRDAHAEFYRAYTELQKTTTTTGERPHQKPTHTILIPDKHLIAFPWESLPILRHVPVTRLPSIFFLRDILVKDQAAGGGVGSRPTTVDRKSVHYVLNPSGDLAKTEQAFKAMVTECAEWTGIIGSAPTEDQCAEALSSKDLYIYFGHGGGEQFIRNHRIRSLDRCAVALLMGCSSGRLKPVGEFDPMGTPISYLLGGSRAVVANLWDVTDGDIDKFSHRVFAEWGLSVGGGTRSEDEPVRSIDEAVARSRDACKLKYLTGAAPVVYGVPVYISSK
ncbi:hypothetical protein HDU86_002180 [Geranomyces michiganensis]|nr:hypothetical protein HDU86_002180 [Geranomyces michiganensis]